MNSFCTNGLPMKVNNSYFQKRPLPEETLTTDNLWHAGAGFETLQNLSSSFLEWVCAGDVSSSLSIYA